jgi:hypothetical protein
VFTVSPHETRPTGKTNRSAKAMASHVSATELLVRERGLEVLTPAERRVCELAAGFRILLPPADAGAPAPRFSG